MSLGTTASFSSFIHHCILFISSSSVIRFFPVLSKQPYRFFIYSFALLSYSFIHMDPSSLAGSEELSWGGAAAIFSNEPLPCQQWGNLAPSSWMQWLLLHLGQICWLCLCVCVCVLSLRIIKPCKR